MKTVGEILRQARTGKGLSIGDVEKKTKIRPKFLTAIEEDSYNNLPSQAYAKGFIKNYSEFLGLNSSTMLAFYRRQTEEAGRAAFVPRGIAHPLNSTRLRLTPSRFIILVVSVLVVFFFLYFIWQYTQLSAPPVLSIENPEGQVIQTSEEKIELIGKTDPDATVTINGISVLVRSDGTFFDQVQLDEGENTIEIVSTSRFGKSQTASVRVVRD